MCTQACRYIRVGVGNHVSLFESHLKGIQNFVICVKLFETSEKSILG